MGLAWLASLLFSGTAVASFSTEPAGCLNKFTPPCSVLTRTKNEFDAPELRLFTSSDALFQFQNAHSVYIARGILWLQPAKEMTIQAKFGSVQIPAGGEYWIDVLEDRMVVKSLREEATVRPRGSKDASAVGPGFQMTVSYVDQSKGEAQSTIPIVISLTEHLKALPKVFPYKTINFHEYNLYLGRVVREAAEASAGLFRDAVQRKVSSAEAEAQRLKYEAVENVRRDSYLQKLFKVKNNFEDQ